MKLKRVISTSSLMFTAIGGMVGSGWLFGPYFTAKIAGPASIIAWLIGGAMMMIIALTFAELATTFPSPGGTVRYAHYSHGTTASFTIAWISWLAALMVAPIETMATIQYAANYFPWLTHISHQTTSLTGMGILVAAILMLFMVIVNCFGVRLFAKSNTFIVSWKLIIPAITVFMLISHHFKTANFTQFSGFMPYGLKGIFSALPTAGVIVSFLGFSSAIQLGAEAKNPQKAISIAILGAIAICIIFYTIIQIAYIGALNPESFRHGWSHLNYAGDAGPIAGVISALGVFWFLKILYADALISPAGTGYIYTSSTARINMAMAENGYMSNLMKKLNKKGSPIVALIVNYFIGMMFFLPFPGWQSMVSFLVSCLVIAYAVGPISCAVLRETMPDIKRPFRIPAYKILCVLAFFISNLIVYWTGWQVIWKTLIIIGMGYPFLYYQHRVSSKPINFSFQKALWLIPYLFGIGLISYLGDFGGGIHVIPFGWDFLVIAIFSVIVFKYAVYCANPKAKAAKISRKTYSEIFS